MHNAGDLYRRHAQDRDELANNYEERATACDAEAKLGCCLLPPVTLRVAEICRDIAHLNRVYASMMRILGSEYDKRIIELNDTSRDLDVTVSVKDVGAFMDSVVSDPVTNPELARHIVEEGDYDVAPDSVASVAAREEHGLCGVCNKLETKCVCGKERLR